MLCQVADALSDSGADEVGGVAQKDGAAQLARVFASPFIFLHWLKTLLYLWLWSHQMTVIIINH